MSIAMKPGLLGVAANAPELKELDGPVGAQCPSQDGQPHGLREREWGLNARMDRTVTFEEYNFWAKIEREMEKVEQTAYMDSVKDQGKLGGFKSYFRGAGPKKEVHHEGTVITANVIPINEKHSDSDQAIGLGPSTSQTHDL